MKFDNEHGMQWAWVIGNCEKVICCHMWIVLFLKVNGIILSCFNVWSL
jgi:hypothetical protein